ncbi:hypothetical protein [Rubrivirga sp. IMCC43871]|uniref:hypothetical protein n=1 Tax=Rubrivirga sp. IMCC43871 TaxID=3391575 RepID=UPI00398FF805
MEDALGYIVALVVFALAVAHLVAAPRSWGTLSFYRQSWRFFTRDPERDKSLDRRLAFTNGIGVTALAIVILFLVLAG